MSDIFREVDEDLRRSRYKQLWERYGIYVIGVAVLIVALTAAWRGWEYWQQQRAERSGDRYIAALELASQDDTAAAIAAFEALAEDGSGSYPVLARLRAATEMAEGGDPEAAAAAFDEVARSSGTPSNLQSIARLRAALIRADKLSYEEIQAEIGDLAATGEPFRHTARDLLGMVAWRTGDYVEARRIFNQIIEDIETPQNLGQRAAVMLDLIDSRLGAPADG